MSARRREPCGGDDMNVGPRFVSLITSSLSCQPPSFVVVQDCASAVDDNVEARRIVEIRIADYGWKM